MSNLLDYLNKQKERLIELKKEEEKDKKIKEMEIKNDDLDIKKIDLLSEIAYLNQKKEEFETIKETQQNIKLFILVSIFTTIIITIMSLFMSNLLFIKLIASGICATLGFSVSSIIISKYEKNKKYLKNNNLSDIESKINEKTDQLIRCEKNIIKNQKSIDAIKKSKEKLNNEINIIANDIKRIEQLSNLVKNNTTIYENIVNRFFNLDWELLFNDVENIEIIDIKENSKVFEKTKRNN